MEYTLGLDLGIASVGWAVLDLDANKIKALGVRAFNSAEDPQTKSPLAEPRRLARSARRRNRRRSERLSQIKDLFVQFGLICDDNLEDTFLADLDKPCPWQLRAEGLDRLLNGEEFARALFHIAKRRGYQSNRRAEGKESEAKESKIVAAGIQENAILLESKGYRTAGEMLFCDEKFHNRKRNAAGDYAHSIGRGILREEIVKLFDSQGQFGSDYASEDLEKQYSDLFAKQLPFASGDLILSKVGYCPFEPSQRRAPKASYTSERFVLLQKINNLSWYEGGERVRLKGEQRHLVEKRAYEKCELKHADVRRLLGLSETARFCALNYGRRPRTEDTEFDELACERKAGFCNLKGYKEIQRLARDADVWEEISKRSELIDEIAYALTFYKTDEDVRKHLEDHQCPPRLVEIAANHGGFRGVLHVSLSAMRKMIPHLEHGEVYSEACRLAGYDHARPNAGQKRLNKLPPISEDEVRNPVVLRALSQARKVVNAVVKRYGPPKRIHIELAREVGKGPKLRQEIDKRIKEREVDNQRRDQEFQELFGRLPKNGEERLKWRLYREQGGKCAYSLERIDLEHRFFEDGYVQIDHIIPYSKSFDDSMSNKAVVLCSENQNKLNRTPFGYFGHDAVRWSQFEAWVNSTIRDYKKRNKLLSQADPKLELEADWIPRNLIDTQYIARDFSNFLRDNLKFADENEKLPVVCLNGFITDHLRGMWGLKKDRQESDLHHAMDAAVIAAVTPRMVQLVTRYRQARETMHWKAGDTYVDLETGEIVDFKYSFPLPWKGFRNEVEDSLKTVIVSRMPRRKATGPIHKETIKSDRRNMGTRIVRANKLPAEVAAQGKPVAVTRKALTDLKEADLAKLFAPETNKKLYDAIRTRLAEHGMDAKKAFAEPLRKPTNDGTDGPEVRKVKLVEPQPSGVRVREGIADNDSMVRVDVFQKAGKYYLVPVYVADFMSGELPGRAIVAYKPEDQWTPIDDAYEFLFSLYPYDLVCIDTGKEEFFGYYRGFDRATGAIALCQPNKADKLIRGIGVKTSRSVEKYAMGILGDYYKVTRETRRGVENGRNIESSEVES